MPSPSDAHRRRKKDATRERSNTQSKDKDRRKSGKPRKTRSSTSKDDDSDGDRSTERAPIDRVSTPLTTVSSIASQKMSIVPEMERRGHLGSPNASRTSLPYPTLSKTFAKENIYSREERERQKTNRTPEMPDTGAPPLPHRAAPAPSRSPPSPPPATAAANLRKTASANSMQRKKAEAVIKEMEAARRSVDSGTRVTSQTGPRMASRSSIREQDTFDGTDLTSNTGSQPSTIRAKSPNFFPAMKTVRDGSEVTLDSDTTSIPVEHNVHFRGPSPSFSETSPASVVDSSPRTPTQHSVLPAVLPSTKDAPPSVVEIATDPALRAQLVDSSMTPPPPPPPPALNVEAPRVDYLLQNGGLTQAIPRSLLAAIDGVPASAYSQYQTPRLSGAQAHDVRAFFKPLQTVLNSDNTVMDTSGSLAVATGYRSVARRLLDRLENVFARNISSEHCRCMMCFQQPLLEDTTSVNWGEILELVSGRCELPTWPPYQEDAKLARGTSTALEAPCQRIDVDVPEQYREHYEKQSKKTKVAVQSWLSDQQDDVPEDADDETLTFIMLTRLAQPQRPLFYALLWGLDKLPNPRTQKPDTADPPYLSKASLALQRLYRLYTAPRHQLVVMYLIRHPEMHNTLSTLAAVSKHEWEILVSGRFDGFLWSGADDMVEPNVAPLRTGSRNGFSSIAPPESSPRFLSPVSPNRFGAFSPSPESRPSSVRPGSTRPSGAGAPIQIDEETEIAVLAEIEREIYLGMEAMEDAFEHLHNQAEMVRRRLRERAAALSMVAQQRSGSGMDSIKVRGSTPANARDPDEGVDDMKSEIGPDDSASNVSHNRRRKAHRARERRTPAPVEEEREEEMRLADRIRRRL